MRKSLLDMATIAVLAGAVLIAAALIGTDANFDLRNYHLYNGYALWHGRLGIDLAPAQLQTFNAPTLDALVWPLWQALTNVPRLLNVVLALPQAIAVCLAWAVARCFLNRFRAICATAIGATGAAMLPTLATALSEAPMACLDLAALWLILRRPSRGLAPGLLAGIAAGLKLTAAPYAVGLIAAAGPKRFLSAASATAIGALICCGWWWFTLWHRYGNPLFPYFNDLFHSPWGDPVRMADLRFMPRGPLQALFYPFYWAFCPVTLASELPVRDPRIALGFVATVLILLRTRSRSTIPLVVFWTVSFVFWELQFSIFRYLAILELVSGTLIVLAAGRLSPAIAVAIIVATIYPDWGRAPPGAQAASVSFPPVPPNSLVVMLDPSPMAYVAASAPPGLRFVGANSNLIHPGDQNRLATEIESAIRTWPGPLWGLEMPELSPGAADFTLRYYGLTRAPGCEHIPSNLDANGIIACPLVRGHS